jgi:hypothetical protein
VKTLYGGALMAPPVANSNAATSNASFISAGLRIFSTVGLSIMSVMVSLQLAALAERTAHLFASRFTAFISALKSVVK